MTAALRNIVRIIAAGLNYSARATAMHEGLPWDGEARRPE